MSTELPLSEVRKLVNRARHAFRQGRQEDAARLEAEARAGMRPMERRLYDKGLWYTYRHNA